MRKHFVSFDQQEAYNHFCEVIDIEDLTPVEAYPQTDANGDQYFHAEFWSDRELSDEEVREINAQVGVIAEVCNVEK
jgi:hypothetical protein